MKKILSIMLAMMLVLALAACGGKKSEKPANSDTVEEEVVVPEEETEGEDVEGEEQEEDADINKPAEPVEKPESSKPAAKPESSKPDEPAQKPEENTEVNPEESAPAGETTLGNTLLADFKGKASSGMSALEIAEGLMQNEAILFSGGAMEVEPGLLSGFDNTEITGFKSGATFMPMIGSIAFVGYVFELEDGADVSAFINNLRSSANMRWNICVEAEEMVTGSVGNKVFFVMCPKTLEE